MSVHLIGSKPPDQDNRMREGDIEIFPDGDKVIMRECLVITKVMIPEQAAAFVQGLSQAGQKAMAIREAATQAREAAMTVGGLGDALGVNGNGVH
jgi:hypothetical protein